MSCELIIKSGNHYEFHIKGVDIHIMNALRRIILSETVTLAIHDVYINQNTSVIPDEVIAQRLGLIPLRVDSSELDLKEEAAATKPDLKRLTRMTARLRLTKKNEGEDIMVVYSSDLKAVDKKTVSPVYGRIPIVKLGKNQEIDVECIAKVGRGKDHAKWSPVSTVAYKIFPRIEVADSCTACGACIDACPFSCLRMELGKPVLKGIGIYDCTLCRLCERACSERALKVIPSNDEFIFKIDLIGQLSIGEIFEQARIIFESKMDDLIQKIENVASR
ncbi:MAG: DNA-directed RNA polymerase subunit D [Candidatus Njordarchaeota archaeon]